MCYHFGLLAPGKSSDPTITVYNVAHHQLLCHAAVVKLYKEYYKVSFLISLLQECLYTNLQKAYGLSVLKIGAASD